MIPNAETLLPEARRWYLFLYLKSIGVPIRYFVPSKKFWMIDTNLVDVQPLEKANLGTIYPLRVKYGKK